MSGCPACGRPLALARATCLYCGAALPEDSVAVAEQARRAALQGPAPAALQAERLLVGFRVDELEAAGLAAALGLPVYDARRLAARGGDHLWRVLPPGEAEAEAARLGRAGLRCWTLPESQVRGQAPRHAATGRRDGGAVLLQAEGPCRVAPGELLLLVQGPIERASHDAAVKRLLGMASPQPGYRFHLHLRAEPRPVELDPEDFELEGGAGGSTLLALREWLGPLVGEGQVDDGFRHLVPALAPAARPEGRAARWSSSLEQARAPERRNEERLLLDNLAQFRFYSAWKGLLARARA